MGKAATRANNKWIAKAYDRINLLVKKGDKEIIQAHAAAMGDSTNAFINRAISQQMQRDKQQQQRQQQQQQQIYALEYETDG